MTNKLNCYLQGTWAAHRFTSGERASAATNPGSGRRGGAEDEHPAADARRAVAERVEPDLRRHLEPEGADRHRLRGHQPGHQGPAHYHSGS